MPLSSDDESDDEERTVQYGIRQSRRNTSHQYRDSSSLDPSQRMEQEVYYHAAEDSIQHSFQLMQLICSLNAIYQHYRSIMSLYVSNVFFATIQSKLDGLKKLIEYLLLISSFVTAHGEIAFLYAEDLSIFIRRRNRFKPKRFRTIQDISRGDCYLWFGIHPAKLERLFAHWRIPDTFRTASRHVYSGQECLIIFLYHLIKGLGVGGVGVGGGTIRYLWLTVTTFIIMLLHPFIKTPTNITLGLTRNNKVEYIFVVVVVVV
jgi:hypothetical protein